VSGKREALSQQRITVPGKSNRGLHRHWNPNVRRLPRAGANDRAQRGFKAESGLLVALERACGAACQGG